METLTLAVITLVSALMTILLYEAGKVYVRSVLRKRAVYRAMRDR